MAKISAELSEEVSNIDLPVKGFIPDWLNGTLIRNGPVTISIDGKTNEHWFDGLAMLHRFHLNEGRAIYTNRFLRSEAYDAVFDKKTLAYLGFAVDPCRSLFSHLFSLFIPVDSQAIHNANVNVAKIANQYVALTEVPLPVTFDEQTLKTLGVLDFRDELPKTFSWMSAHPHTNSSNGNSLNYTVIYGRNSKYEIYEVSPDTAVRRVFATVPVEKPSYMHSFSITDNYIILTQYPLVVTPLKLLLGWKPFIKNYQWIPEMGTKFTVIDRKEGVVVKEYATRPFFSFHHVNAFEENGQIYLDIVTYQDASIITHGLFDINSGKMQKGDNYQTQLERFCLGEELSSEVIYNQSIELPRINEAYDGKKHRYIYAMGFSNSMKERSELLYSTHLCKIDTKTKQAMSWSKPGCAPGEPVFIASPNPQREDDGVIVSVVLDRKNKNSFLLVLDAFNFTEIGTAEAPHAIPPGLHGQFFKI